MKDIFVMNGRSCFSRGYFWRVAEGRLVGYALEKCHLDEKKNAEN